MALTLMMGVTSQTFAATNVGKPADTTFQGETTSTRQDLAEQGFTSSQIQKVMTKGKRSKK